MQLSVDQLEASAQRFQGKGIVKKAVKDGYESFKRKVIDAITPGENLDKRKRMLREVSAEPLEFAYERAIGKNDSVYSNFTDILNAAKRKVGRIVVKDGIRNLNFATGFMVSERLMLTNWHVFRNIDAARDSELQFGYELDPSGRPKTPVIFKFAVEEFFHNHQALDYCLVAVQPFDVSGRISLSEFGYHFLDPGVGKLAGEGQEFVNIIHHPDGDYMQFSIRENRFLEIQDNTIWYAADTAPGSSGSPVFNDQFQIVALHHMGVPKRSKDGRHYLDKKGKIVPVENGSVDAGKIHWIANEGIRISRLVEHLLEVFPDNPLVKGLQLAPKPSEILPTQLPERPVHNSHPQDDIHISISRSMLSPHGVLNIAIQDKPGGMETGSYPVDTNLSSELELELRRVTQEEAMDFSGCHGYDPNFLGTPLPMPVPLPDTSRFAAKIKNTNEIELKYHHYSTIHHAIRKMPMVSAVNVDGDEDKRLDKAKREDNWLRDKRIDFEAQLNEKYYLRSGFDKGHMSRREDANWGSTAEEAKSNADLTCMHTNACPQVAKLNQSKRKGLWGKLEILILEKGATKEDGESARISVFNGPIFSEKDPIFKGIQIPMEFWKLVVWKSGKKKLKATAFKLSQAAVVGEIDFEALDFDKNLEFKEFQCSIQSLAAQTNLDFSAFKRLDTFKKKSGGKAVPIDNMEALMEMIQA